MELYGGNKIHLTSLQKILRDSTDKQLEAMNLSSTLEIKIAILKEFSFRHFAEYSDLSDNEVLQKCHNESQLERSLALRVATFKKLVS